MTRSLPRPAMARPPDRGSIVGRHAHSPPLQPSSRSAPGSQPEAAACLAGPDAPSARTRSSARPTPTTLRGTAAGDRICGLAGNDALRGFEGDDCLFGGPGNDAPWGGPGGDRLTAARATTGSWARPAPIW